MTDLRDEIVLSLLKSVDYHLWYQSNPETRKQMALDAYAFAEVVIDVKKRQQISKQQFEQDQAGFGSTRIE